MFKGESPYPGVPPRQVANMLQTGYRMPRPRHISAELWVVFIASHWLESYYVNIDPRENQGNMKWNYINPARSSVTNFYSIAILRCPTPKCRWLLTYIDWVLFFENQTIGLKCPRLSKFVSVGFQNQTRNWSQFRYRSKCSHCNTLHDCFTGTPLRPSVGKSSRKRGQHFSGFALRSEDFWMTTLWSILT